MRWRSRRSSADRCRRRSSATASSPGRRRFPAAPPRAGRRQDNREVVQGVVRFGAVDPKERDFCGRRERVPGHHHLAAPPPLPRRHPPSVPKARAEGRSSATSPRNAGPSSEGHLCCPSLVLPCRRSGPEEPLPRAGQGQSDVSTRTKSRGPTIGGQRMGTRVGSSERAFRVLRRHGNSSQAATRSSSSRRAVGWMGVSPRAASKARWSTRRAPLLMPLQEAG